MTRHGMSKTKFYGVWKSMRKRCFYEKGIAYQNYGGRGITICKSWFDSFENFYADMFPSYKPGLSLDRINNDGNYEPSNCRWVDAKQQVNNRRITYNAKGYQYIKGKYRVRIKIGNRTIHVGMFGNKEIAKQKYIEAKKQYSIASIN